ncbi:brassinosteroid-responsive RING protein 1-like [Phragmites australis]|uniref:brassinosteroid-responsive RING protein 1-like n=1 Tax=Phragmites australis TaxID=29695 RepID=UPI002D76E650|nr:brassinosteroid-responsive RING protein 1-like [Phragmites australis]
MGFPVGYSDMLLPRVLLQVLLLLGHLHRFLLWAFHAVGLGDLVDNYPLPAATAQEQWSVHSGAAAAALQHRRPEFRAVPAVVIEEALPVVRFDELASVCGDGDCAVCLSGIGGGDEVHRLSNCRHAFHRGCLDRWMAHDQRTCPLCRSPLIPGGELWGGSAAPWPDASDYDLSYPSLLQSPLQMVPTPTLLRPHELLLNGLGGFQ